MELPPAAVLTGFPVNYDWSIRGRPLIIVLTAFLYIVVQLQICMDQRKKNFPGCRIFVVIELAEFGSVQGGGVRLAVKTVIEAKRVFKMAVPLSEANSFKKVQVFDRL